MVCMRWIGYGGVQGIRIRGISFRRILPAFRQYLRYVGWRVPSSIYHLSYVATLINPHECYDTHFTLAFILID